MADIVIDGGSSFDDLQDLIDNSENGDTIILGGDISGNSTEVDMSTIYVDSAWTGKAVGDDLGDGKIFGVNAFAGLQAAVNAVTEDETTIVMMGGTYDGNVDITIAAVGEQKGDICVRAADDADVTITGLVTVGYYAKGVGSAKWNAAVSFEGITFDQAEDGKHSLSVQSVKSITLDGCEIVGDGEFGVSSPGGNNTEKVVITNTTFTDAGMQALGNFSSNMTIDNCTFNESRINVQGGQEPGFTIKNSTFNNTLTSRNEGDSFYVIRTNDDTIFIEGCTFNVDSDLTEVAADQSKWAIFWQRQAGSRKWEVTDCEINLTDAAMQQTELLVNKNGTTTPANAADRIVINGLSSTTNDVDALIAKTEGYLNVVNDDKLTFYDDGEALGKSTVYVNSAYANLKVGATAGDGKIVGYNAFADFESALAAATSDAEVTRIELESNITQNSVVNGGKTYNIIKNLTIGSANGQKFTVEFTGDAQGMKCFGIYARNNDTKFVIEEGVELKGVNVVANGFATSNNEMVIDGHLSTVSLKLWTANNGITVGETGSVVLGYGDGQLDWGHVNNSYLTVNGTLTSTAEDALTAAGPQFKAGYSGTRNTGAILNLNNTYFEAGAWFNINGKDGKFNLKNSVLKVSNGAANHKLSVAGTGNVIDMTDGSRLAAGIVNLSTGNTVKIDGSAFEAGSVDNNGSEIIISQGGVLTADSMKLTGKLEVSGLAAGDAREIQVALVPVGASDGGQVIYMQVGAGKTTATLVTDTLLDGDYTLTVIDMKSPNPATMVFTASATIANGKLTVKDGKVNLGTLNANVGEVEVSGDSQVVIDDLTSGVINVAAGSSLTDSKIAGGGTVSFKEGVINFYGDNEITVALDGMQENFDFVVNENASLLVSRYTLGYGRDITVNGVIDDATALENTDGVKLSLKANSSSGFSLNGEGSSVLTVNNAYVELNNTSLKAGATGTFSWNFSNAYVHAASLGNKNAAGEGGSWTTVFDDSQVVANYLKSGFGVSQTFSNGATGSFGSMGIDGTLTIDATSSVKVSAYQNNKKGALDEHGDIQGTLNIAGSLEINATGNLGVELYGADVNVNGGTFNTTTNDIILDAASTLDVTAGGVLTSVNVANNGTMTLDNGTVSAKSLTVNGALNMDGVSKVTVESIATGADGMINVNLDQTELTDNFYLLIEVTGDSDLDTDLIKVNGEYFAEGAKFGDYTVSEYDNELFLFKGDRSTVYVNSAWADNKLGDDLGNGKIFGGNAFSSMEEVSEVIYTDGKPTTIKFESDIDLPQIVEMKYGTGDVIFDADSAVTISQTALGSDFLFVDGKDMNVVIKENVTFNIYDNASGFYMYYGPSLELYGTITGGQNWGTLYLYNGAHHIYDTATVSAGRFQIGFTSVTVTGDADSGRTEAHVDTNYLLVECSKFTATEAIIDAGVIHDSNNGGMRWGESEFYFTDSTVVAGAITIKYADSVMDIAGTSITVNGTFTNAGKFSMDAASTLTANALVNTGSITIDAANFGGGVKQVINLSGTESLDGQVTVENADDVDVIYGADGDVFLSDVAMDKVYVNAAYTGKFGDEVAEGKYLGINAFADFESALAAATSNAEVTRIELESNITQNSVVNGDKTYNIIKNLTIGSANGQKFTVEFTGDAQGGACFGIYARNNDTKFVIEEGVELKGVDVVANGFATSNNEMVIDGHLSAVSLKLWTANNGITVGETGSVVLGYGDGQLDWGHVNNSYLTVNGTLTSTAEDALTAGPQFKAGYSGTRNTGAILNLNNTYFEAGAWFNINGKDGKFNLKNSVLKVSGGDAAGKLSVAGTGNVIDMTDGSRLAVGTLILGADNTLTAVDSSLEFKTMTNNGVVTITDTVITADEVNNGNDDAFFVYGESTLNITKSVGDVNFCDGAIIKDSTVGGAVYVGGAVTFCGDNTFTMISDYGDYYNKTTPSTWTIEKGASVTLTSFDRYGLGYGDKIYVYGELTDAKSARSTLTAADASFNAHGGLVGMTNSAAPNAQNSFVVEDAYVRFGFEGDKSFGNKPGNYYGNYTFSFTNTVFDANGFKFYEDKGTSVLTFKDSDVLVNGVFMTNDSSSSFTFDNTKVISKAASNGSDDKNQNAGMMILKNGSSISYNAKFTNVGTLSLDLTSTLIFNDMANTGTITIDMTNVDAAGGNVLFDRSGNDWTLADYKALFGSSWTSDMDKYLVVNAEGDLAVNSLVVAYVNSTYSAEELAEGNKFLTHADAAEAGALKIITTGGTVSANVEHDGIGGIITGGTFNATVSGSAITQSGRKEWDDRSGDVLLQINDGTFNKMVMGGERVNAGNTEHIGNLVTEISGGVFNAAVVGGMVYAASSVAGQTMLTGNVELTITGGTFNKFIYGGSNAGKAEYSSRNSIEGDITVTIDASDNKITFGSGMSLIAGSYRNGMVYGNTQVIFSGNSSNLDYADNFEIWGGCSGDYYIGTGDDRTFESSVTGTRTFTFDGFEGEFSGSIRGFSNFEVTGSSNVDVLGGNLADIEVWEFGTGSVLGGTFVNNFAGDTLNIEFSDSFAADGWVLMEGAEAMFDGVEKLAISINGTSLTFDAAVSKWSNGSYAVEFTDSDEAGKKVLAVSKLA